MNCNYKLSGGHKQPSDVPRCTHGLMHQAVGLRIVHKELFLWIEPKLPAQTHGYFGQVDQGAGAVPVLFVEGEFLTRAYGLEEIRKLRLWIREALELFLQIRNVRAESWI